MTKGVEINSNKSFQNPLFSFIQEYHFGVI